LSVDGTIVLQRPDDVVYVGRPAQGQPDGGRAERVTVKLGRSSVNTIEVKEGLRPGDQVILSDMSARDGFDSIRLN
jgi:HlyD family secretion protein